jgi:hypothetical protein
LKSLRKRDHLEALGVAGRIILKWFLKEKIEDMMYGIHVNED